MMKIYWLVLLVTLCMTDAYLISEKHKTLNKVIPHQRDSLLKRDINPCKTSTIIDNDDGTINIDIRFPRAEVAKDDKYLCTAQKVPYGGEESYITKFLPHSSMNNVHHLILYGCETPESSEDIWGCSLSESVCGNHSSNHIIYAWANAASSLTLPQNVGFRIGGASKLAYLVVQLLYSHKLPPRKVDCSGLSVVINRQKQKYYAGILLLASSFIKLQPHSNSTADVSCKSPTNSTLHVFAFRMHAHSTGIITGYRVRRGKVTMIGKGNPQWSRAFYPRIGGSVDIKKGDSLLVRCLYESNKDKPTVGGMTGNDEMCNFYMMYYTRNKNIPELTCWDNQLNISSNRFPSNANNLAPYPGFAGKDSTNASRSGEAAKPLLPGNSSHDQKHKHDDDDDGGDNDDDDDYRAADEDNDNDDGDGDDDYRSADGDEDNDDDDADDSKLGSTTNSAVQVDLDSLPTDEDILDDLDCDSSSSMPVTTVIILVSFLLLTLIVCVVEVRSRKMQLMRCHDKENTALYKKYSLDPPVHEKRHFQVGRFRSRHDPRKQGFMPLNTIMSEQSESEDELFSNTINSL